jgi:hypothetical protein
MVQSFLGNLLAIAIMAAAALRNMYTRLGFTNAMAVCIMNTKTSTPLMS